MVAERCESVASPRKRKRGASDGSEDEDGGDKYARSTKMASGTTLIVYSMAPATDHIGTSRMKSIVCSMRREVL
jgi:hypothetical protein